MLNAQNCYRDAIRQLDELRQKKTAGGFNEKTIGELEVHLANLKRELAQNENSLKDIRKKLTGNANALSRLNPSTNRFKPSDTQETPDKAKPDKTALQRGVLLSGVKKGELRDNVNFRIEKGSPTPSPTHSPHIKRNPNDNIKSKKRLDFGTSNLPEAQLENDRT